jgi:ketosteroid isomerase-like protein
MLIWSQESKSDSLIVKEVNETLWKEFKKAYEAKDADAFNALHTEDVMRISPNRIKLGEEYFQSNIKNFAWNPEREQVIDFSMEHRVYNGDHGYEVGFYRIVYTIDQEIVHTSYARFHVRLRKEGGHWKIAQDWDIDQIAGKEINEEHFNEAELLELGH